MTTEVIGRCIFCDAWGCTRCRSPYEVAAERTGDQGYSSDELEVLDLRDKVRELGAELERTKLELVNARARRGSRGPWPSPAGPSTWAKCSRCGFAAPAGDWLTQQPDTTPECADRVRCDEWRTNGGTPT